MPEESIGALIKRFRLAKGLSQRKLAVLSGKDRGYINQLEAGRGGSISLETAKAFAMGLGVSPSVFLGDIKSPEAALSEIEVSIKAYIPVYDEVSAGEGIEPIDYVACTRTKPAPESLRAYRVKGLCLSPDIEEWDTLIVDTDLSPQNGDLVICIMDGEASVKRFKEDGKGNKWLENNTGKFQPEDVYIDGVVVEFNRKRR